MSSRPADQRIDKIEIPLRGVQGARQGPIAGYVLQSAAPAGPSPWVSGAYHHNRTPHLCVWM
eukprot:scaffold6327_cov61-Phaeocystis_antarctica.AAC.12